MSKSLIYRSARAYDFSMRVLYGRHYESRYQTIADLIPPRASVLDLCCGPGLLYSRYLRHTCRDYLGLDINPKFVDRVVALGGRGTVWDLQKNRALPPADYVIMQASLYHFLPDASPVIDRMLEAAGNQVIIAEPIRNLTTTKFAWLARSLTDPGTGSHLHRFTESSLDAFLGAYGRQLTQSFLIAGGREKVYVLSGLGGHKSS